MATVTAAKDRQETRVQRTTTLRDSKADDGGKTTVMRRAKQPAAGEDEAEARVKAGEGNTKHRKDYMPRMDDTPFGNTG